MIYFGKELAKLIDDLKLEYDVYCSREKQTLVFSKHLPHFSVKILIPKSQTHAEHLENIPFKSRTNRAIQKVQSWDKPINDLGISLIVQYNNQDNRTLLDNRLFLMEGINIKSLVVNRIKSLITESMIKEINNLWD